MNADQSPKGRTSTVRLQKILAEAGMGSRRQLDQAIEAGRVFVNSKRAPLGTQVGLDDQVSYERRQFRVVSSKGAARTLIYNKPEGEITTRNDPEGRRTVFASLPKINDGRWIAVGRLDIHTAGLLLLTTDGELANKMMHPSSEVDREYLCRLHGHVSDEQLNALKKGVELEDGLARFTDIKAAHADPDNKWFYVVIMEGRNREVRRLWESQNVQVSRLKRVRYGSAFLPKNLKRGHYHEITSKDHQVLREDVGLPPESVKLSLKPVNSKSARRSARRASNKPPASKTSHKSGRQTRHSRASKPASKKR